MSIKFYKAFSAPIKAISFDLDDTLYSNDVIINDAEQAQFTYLCSKIPTIKEQGIQPWLDLKWHVLAEQPELKHDVTLWRLAVIKYGLAAYIKDSTELNDLSIKAFKEFYRVRSNFSIDQNTHDVLSALSKKFPLVAVTNGNADIDRLNLSQYFVGYWRAGENNCRMKPYPDMLNQVSLALDLPLSNILHVGDNITSDIKGALNAKTNSFWFNPDKKSLPIGASYAANLPNAEYSHLDDLLQLL